MLIPNTPTTSSRCGSNACVQVTLTDQVQVEDTKDGGEETAFDVAGWRRFVAAVKTGQLDG